MPRRDQSSQAYLDDLIVSLPITISQLDESLINIDDQRDFLYDDWFGVSASMSMMTTAASGWMYEKAAELGFNKASVQISGSWGDDNLIEWAIIDKTLGEFNVVYSDASVASGAPSATETQQYNRQLDFPAAYDHIWRDIGLNGTYGIEDKISKLTIAEDLQTINRDKYSTVLKAYSRNRDI